MDKVDYPLHRSLLTREQREQRGTSLGELSLFQHLARQVQTCLMCRACAAQCEVAPY